MQFAGAVLQGPTRGRLDREVVEQWSSTGRAALLFPPRPTRLTNETRLYIERIEVEEGFLDGLCLEFTGGLNVVIGPRGVGKTSLVELLRFGVGAPGYTERSGKDALAHALSVLGSGRVTVTLVQNSGERIALVRGAGENEPRIVSAGGLVRPIVLSQTEIEQIGLEPASRVRLIDGFRSVISKTSDAEHAATSMVSSITAEIRGISQALGTANERLLETGDIDARFTEAQTHAAQASATIDASHADQKRLEDLSRAAAGLEVRRTALERAATDASGFGALIRGAAGRAPDIQWPTVAGESDEIRGVVTSVRAVVEALNALAETLEVPASQVKDAAQATQESLVRVQDDARVLRRKVDQLSEGAGQATQLVAKLQALRAQRLALLEEVATLSRKAEALRTRRGELLDELERAREQRFSERNEVARQINLALGPIIHVRVDRDAGLTAYIASIADVLQGSGLHYNTLKAQLAQLVSPRELVEAIEQRNSAALATLTGLSQDRTSRIIATAEVKDLDRILTATIEDTVEILLLDESVPKPAQTLSTGQRCTAILPIVLMHNERILILDQPEDHLDNAYVVDTLVKSIQKRSEASQTIVATHNANIPVLGDAARVIVLGSDGKHGFVRLAGRLHNFEIVQAITQVMEGGADAFKLRAQFYDEYLSADGSR
jgi:Fe-S cluster assembly ATPase SufC